MRTFRAAIAGILSLLVVSAAVAQTFPTVPANTVIGRIGQPGQSGPSQAIPFATLASKLGVQNYLPVYNVATYATPQAAVNAAIAGNGGVVYFPCGTYSLGSGAKGLDLDNVIVPIRLTGPANMSSGADCLFIQYSGTGTMISAKGSIVPEIDHLYLYSTTAAIGLDLGEGSLTVGSTFPSIHDNFVQVSSGPTAIGVKITKTQGAVIRKNFLGVTGTNIYIACSAGEWATSPVITENTFGASGQTSIACPSGATMVSNNIAEFPAVAFISAGVGSGGCHVMTVENNWIGDFTVPATNALVHSNCQILNSRGNTYAHAVGGTNIKQDNSTGYVKSDGDIHQATTGINIGTGNKLFVNGSTITPGTMVVGTPIPTPASESWFSIGAANGISLALGNVDLLPTYTYKLSVGNGLTNSAIGVGQASGTSLFIGWNYAAVIANASAYIGTSGYNNPLSVDASAVSINQLSSGATTIYNSGAAPTGTGAYVRATSPTLVTPALGTPASGVATNLTGTAASLTAGTATNAVNSGITNDTTTNATMYPVWVTANTGNLPLKVTSTKLSYNPSTDIFTAGGMSFGNSTGVAGLFFNGTTMAFRAAAGGSIFFQDAAGTSGGSFNTSTLALAINGAITAGTTVKGTTGFTLTNLLSSSTAPTATTFCTTPSIPANNGTAAFTINVGTACATSVGTITMPAATTGWVCDFQDVTNPDSNLVRQTGGTTTTVTVKNYSATTGVAANWTNSEVIRAKCSAY